MDRVVFITGVTGFLGEELLSLLAADAGSKIYCLVRPSKSKSAADRLADILTEIGITDTGRIEAIEGDLRHPQLGIARAPYDRLTGDVTHILHSAADVRFNQPLEKMRAINVEGARNIMAFARDCQRVNPRFSHVDYVSTAFVAGRQHRVVCEADATDRFGFKNTYEQTKYEAERVVDDLAQQIPTIVYRPSIVVGASESGKAKPRNVIYPVLRLFSKWRLPVVPINKKVRLDVVPVDFVAKAILALSANPKNLGGHFHLAAGPEGDIVLPRMLELVEYVFGRHVFVMPIPAWKYLVRPCLRTFGRRFYERSRGIFAAFESYLWETGPRYDINRTRAALEGSGVALPDTERFLMACLNYAHTSGFASTPSLSED